MPARDWSRIPLEQSMPLAGTASTCLQGEICRRNSDTVSLSARKCSADVFFCLCCFTICPVRRYAKEPNSLRQCAIHPRSNVHWDASGVYSGFALSDTIAVGQGRASLSCGQEPVPSPQDALQGLGQKHRATALFVRLGQSLHGSLVVAGHAEQR